MKNMVLFGALFLSSLSLWAEELQLATCPADSKTIVTCKSTPTQNDGFVAGGMFDSIAVCETKSGDKPEFSMSFRIASIEERDKATKSQDKPMYTAEGEGIKLSLYLQANEEKTALFSVQSAELDLDESSTYNCK